MYMKKLDTLFNVRMDSKLKKKLESKAIRDNTNLSEVTKLLLDSWLHGEIVIKTEVKQIKK